MTLRRTPTTWSRWRETWPRSSRTTTARPSRGWWTRGRARKEVNWCLLVAFGLNILYLYINVSCCCCLHSFLHLVIAPSRYRNHVFWIHPNRVKNDSWGKWHEHRSVRDYKDDGEACGSADLSSQNRRRRRQTQLPKETFNWKWRKSIIVLMWNITVCSVCIYYIQ